jgi:RNA polymerase sigma-70 factor (ECF subfamily)
MNNQSQDVGAVHAVLRGDREAYGPLVQRHQKSLFNYARKMVLDDEVSLDIVQEAFVKAYVRIRDCREPGHFRAWLFSIARNMCLDYLKDVRRRSVPFSLSPGVQDIPWNASPELKQTLTEALASLPQELRDAFLLKHEAGYTYEEIAEISAVKTSAAKMRVHRARLALSSFLKGNVASEVTIGQAPGVFISEDGFVTREET